MAQFDPDTGERLADAEYTPPPKEAPKPEQAQAEQPKPATPAQPAGKGK